MSTAKEELAPIERLILEVRGQRVILAAELARIYGVETRTLNQAVKRNIEKFPPDFMFQLTRDEATALSRSRSQFVILKRGSNIKYLPYVFTEHGAIMAANVLNSRVAAQMSIFVVRAFVHLRQMMGTNAKMAKKLAELERRVSGHDEAIRSLVQAIRELMATPEPRRRAIGFRVEEGRPAYRARRPRGRAAVNG
jgi:ATP-dependent Clp protease ATP-binding subunit ClpA